METALQIWQVLVDVCGATDSKDNKSMFLFRQTNDDPPNEYRFGGHLGHGGKFWNEHDRWHVTCYREDETPTTRKLIDIANQALEKLKLEAIHEVRDREDDSMS
jgi:hypothetical protein